MESGATLAAVEHELEVADAIRRDILNECAEISELSEAQEVTNLSKKKLKEETEQSELELNQARALANTVKTTPRMMSMSDLMYKLKNADFMVPGPV
jgi:hypothetical protein